MAAHDPAGPLREAIVLSPDNLPLRRLLAQTLLDTGRADEAEVEFRVGLDQAPDDVDSKIGLARSFAQQGKKGQSLVVREDLAGTKTLEPRHQVTVARLLLRQEQRDAAERLYTRAV